MKKVAVYLDSDPYRGGVFQYSLNLIDALSELKKNGYETVILYRNKEWEVLIDEKKHKLLKVNINLLDKIMHRVNMWMPNQKNIIICLKHLNKYFHTLGRIINKNGIDLCAFPTNGSYSYMFDVLSVGFIHDLMHRYEKHFPEVGEKSIYNGRERIYKKMCSISDAIVVDSTLGKLQVIESYFPSAQKIYVLPYISNIMNTVKELEHIDVLKKYKIPKKFILYPAQFWKHKNHANLIKAFSKIKDNEVGLVLIGSEKNNYKDVNRLINELDISKRIRILGYVSENDKVFLYKKAIAMIMPTFFGPTNIPPLEAFELGCPVLISNVYGMPDQVGEAAILFDPYSINEISKAINLICSNNSLRNELIQKGYEKHQNWNKEHFNKKLNNIVESIFNVNV